MCGAASLGTGISAGDAACLISALFYSGWAIAIGHHAVHHGCPLTTALIQFGLAGVLLAPVALALETPTYAGVVAAGPEVLYLAVFCTTGACILTAIAQRRVSASVAVVLLSLEGVFGAAAAYLVLAERPSTEVISGGLLIVIAVVVAAGGRETGASRLHIFSPASAHICPTLEGDMPTAPATVARLCCVALAGVSRAVLAITFGRTSLGRGSTREGRVLSRPSPGTPLSR
jgi:hypothetical protein